MINYMRWHEKIRKENYRSNIMLVTCCGMCRNVIFHNKVKSISTLKKVDDHPLYTMEYSVDYGLDKFLEIGAKSDKELTNL